MYISPQASYTFNDMPLLSQWIKKALRGHRLNSTPLRCKSALRPWGYAPMLADGKPPREQPALASLESQLSDSASLGYLRRCCLRNNRCREAKLPSPSKEKYGIPEWVCQHSFILMLCGAIA